MQKQQSIRYFKILFFYMKEIDKAQLDLHNYLIALFAIF